MRNTQESIDDNSNTQSLTIRSQVEAVKKLMEFARTQSNLIENYYRYNNSGKVFRSPMDIQAGNCGNSERSDFPSQTCAYYLAKNIYYALCQDLENGCNVLMTVKKIKRLFDNNPFEMESTSRKKFADAIACGEESISVSPIPDHFYSAYIEFGRKLYEIMANFEKIPDDTNTWLNELKLLFAQHARVLIYEGHFKPNHFLETLESYYKDLKPKTDSNDYCYLDFTYLYKISTLFSVYTRSAHFENKNGRLEFISHKFSTAELMEKLKKYFSLVDYQPVTNVFLEVFNEVYLQEIEYPIAQRKATKTSQNGEQRWKSTQFWNEAQKDHQRSMASTLACITTLPKDADSDSDTDDAQHKINF